MDNSFYFPRNMYQSKITQLFKTSKQIIRKLSQQSKGWNLSDERFLQIRAKRSPGNVEWFDEIFQKWLPQTTKAF